MRWHVDCFERLMLIQSAAKRSIGDVVEPRAGSDPSLFRLAYRLRGAFVAPVILAAAVLARHAHPHAGSLGAGAATFLAGWGGRMWAQRHLGYRLRRRMRLTTCGPYRRVRNPIYIANTLVVTGTTLLTGDPWLVAAAIGLCAAVYGLTVRHEEARLARWYGRRYLAYVHTTPRWLPSVPAPPDGVGCACARHWTEVALAEWHVPLVLVPVLVPLIIR